MLWLLCEEAERNRKCFWLKHWFEGNNFSLTVFKNGGKGETEEHTPVLSCFLHLFLCLCTTAGVDFWRRRSMSLLIKRSLGAWKKKCAGLFKWFWSLKPEPLSLRCPYTLLWLLAWDTPTPFSDPFYSFPGKLCGPAQHRHHLKLPPNAKAFSPEWTVPWFVFPSHSVYSS